MKTSEIEEVLHTAANLIIPHSGQKNWPTFLIQKSITGPMVLHKRGKGDEYIILLNSQDRRWCQYVFQFAHELGHILCNYQKNSSSIRWLEESISEVASLFVLLQMEHAWKKISFYDQDPSYAVEFTKYCKARMRMAEEIPDDQFKLWWKDRLPSLQHNPIHRKTNLVIARKLLPLFQNCPEVAWKACRTLNQNQPHSHSSFKDTILAWSEASKEPLHKSFVLSLEKVFLP